MHFVDEVYDQGPILQKATVPVLPDDTPATLAARVLEQVSLNSAASPAWAAQSCADSIGTNSCKMSRCMECCVQGIKSRGPDSLEGYGCFEAEDLRYSALCPAGPNKQLRHAALLGRYRFLLLWWQQQQRIYMHLLVSSALRLVMLQEHVLYSQALSHLVEGRVRWDEASQTPSIVSQ